MDGSYKREKAHPILQMVRAVHCSEPVLHDFLGIFWRGYYLNKNKCECEVMRP